MERKLSRKEFLTIATKCAAGATAGVAGLSLITAKKGEAQTEIPAWPWPYAKLDPEYVRKLGHQAYWEAGRGCSYGAFKAITRALQETVGYPFTLIPPEIMIFGHGGVVGWGGTCGGLLGACAAISLVCDKATADKLIHELQGWYTQALFPSETSNRYAQNHEFFVNQYDQPLPQSRAGSPLCHASVTMWCDTSGFKASSLERKERCARLTGDVAARAVELLNEWADGHFQGTYTPPQSMASCVTCHGSQGLDNVKAQMNCTQCHVEGWDHR